MSAVSEREKAELKDFRKVLTEDRHNIQTHADYLGMLVSLTLTSLLVICPMFHPTIDLSMEWGLHQDVPKPKSQSSLTINQSQNL